MFHILLIIFLTFNFSISNVPILIASPYPFNTSKPSHIQCFSNDQGIILSLTIVAKMIDNNIQNHVLESNLNNITKNGSIILTIPTSFNYSQLDSKIECRSIYYHGQQKTSQLQVLSVVEIPQNELSTMNTYTKQMVIINCLTYGTNVFINWNFCKDISKDIFGSLPIRIEISQKYISNDTLIINHVSYSDHHGYYRCSATNKLLGITYEDTSIIYLNVKKNSIWIPIVIVCLVIGLSILILILCSKYYQKKRNNQQLKERDNLKKSEEIMDKINNIVPDQESIELSIDYNKENSSELILENGKEFKTQQDDVHTFSHLKNSTKSLTSLLTTENEQYSISTINSPSIYKTSPQFVLSNPFLDSNVQPVTSMKRHKDKLK